MANGSSRTLSRPLPAAEAVRSHTEYLEGDSLVEAVHKDLLLKRLSIDGCRDIIQYLRDHDVTTRHRLEGILALKGQRAGDTANRLARISAHMKRKRANTQ